MRRDIHELQGPLEKNLKNKLRELLAEKALARSARKRVQEGEEAAMAAATAQAAALTAEMTGIMPPTPVQAIRIRCRETNTRRGLKDAAALSITTKDEGEGEGGNSAAVFVPMCLPSPGSPAANYRSAAAPTSFAAQWRAREFGAPATPARAASAPFARARPISIPVAVAVPTRPAWGRPIEPASTEPIAPVPVPAPSPAPAAGTLASLSDAQLAAGAAFAAAAPLLTSAYAGVKTFSATLPAAKRLLAAGADALLGGVLPSGGAPVPMVAIECDVVPNPTALADGPPMGRRSLRHQVTHGVAQLSGGVLSADSALARVAGSAAEAGAAAAVGLAVNAAAVGCAAAAAGVAATAAAILTPPLFAGLSAFVGGRALWRALSGSRA
ncbi:hypothetical protein Rsub_04585 [Raphidocelis subcapitata]|uniref:Uncharacterized protein n=1 Tax=Raphidocelis subcapitata TaxID=307507 RepID=A0A2V0NXX1_9CHLO|nr:hypothetical protein Rsub_04585 [Raphidocelis subcapitata]|eukprot:GBF92481.1 hypothetical protein Rsub_04585 [Raphidocelis subcapitata]